MDPPVPNRRSSEISGSADSSVTSPTTMTGTSAEDNVRPSAEEWYPRLYLGWNHKECVDVYCYFISRPFHQDFKIKWAIHPLGPPFHGKSHPMSFGHTLQLVDTQNNSKMVERAITVGLSTEYHWQIKFKDGAPVYKHVERTPEEILTAWENHTLAIPEDENAAKVKDAIMLIFEICITNEEVELLTRFSTLIKVSVFETNTWRQMLCFRSCPKMDVPDSPAAPISRKENSRKRKNDDTEQTSSKRPALLADDVPSRDRTLQTSNAGQAPISSKHSEATSQSAGSGTDLVSKATINTDKESSSSRVIGTEPEDESPTPAIPMSEAFSTTLTISSWLRLLPTLTFHSERISISIQKWLKDSFAIDPTLEEVTRITDSAKAENISPLRTTAFKCIVATARKDLGAILMSPHVPTGIDFERRGSLRGFSKNVEAAVRKVSGGSQTEAKVVGKPGGLSISSCA